MKNIVVPLIGLGNSGKSRTLRRFFGLPENSKKWAAEKKIGDILIICRFFGSPQELRNDVTATIKDIKKRLDYCKTRCRVRGCKKFILLLPMTIERKRGGSVEENLTTAAMNMLIGEGYKVEPIYLQKLDPVVERFVKQFTKIKIESLSEPDRQAKDLKKILGL
ncbi:MAG: hypothetical protein JXC85_01685 [Candidatus Aenigmarchaeota archaeon]|nr:hypothetical protein [Candidatus Aenigmarchaeota archaeon]